MKVSKLIKLIFLAFSFDNKKEQTIELVKLEKLQKVLGYRFTNLSLLIQALSHRSYVDPEDKKRLLSNERLEFLGDAVLNCLATEHLFMKYPDKSEGQLSKIKSLIVSRKILGEIALNLNLGQFLLLGQSERRDGKTESMSILSNAFEAVVGAIYLDGGIEATRTFLKKHHWCKIDLFLNDTSNVNYKSRILELSQADGFGTPVYRLIMAKGPDHAKEFTVSVEIAGIELGIGTGPNKKIAQQNAAKMALEKYSKELLTSSSKGVKNELVFDR